MVDGRVCNISVNGQQIVRNFIREYRREKSEVEFTKDILNVEFNLYGLSIGLLHFKIFNTTREGAFKFLPYYIKDLRDLYGFTSKLDASSIFFSNTYEMDVTEGCLQDAIINIIRDQYMQEINPTKENITGTRAPETVLRCGHELCQYNCCLLVESDIEKRVSHIFMFVMTSVDMWIKTIQTGLTRPVQVTCTVTVNSIEDNIYNSYKPYTINECCSTGKAHKYPYEFEDGFKNTLYCHRPYQVTEILAIISLFLSYCTVVVFPLAIKWVPSAQSTDHPNVR